VSKFIDESPVCDVDACYEDTLKGLVTSVRKYNKYVYALIVAHKGQPHEDVKQAKIALCNDVFELRQALQLSCIRKINEHFGYSS
jgi:hypothetical protein